jgi:hypothetical protein
LATASLVVSGTSNTSALTVGNVALGAGDATRFKNRIINGDMRIDQRNAGASVTPANAQYTLDRWQSVASVASKYSIQQNAGSVTPPAGFKNYLGVTSLSAYSVGAGELFSLLQPIEGFNTSDLGFGAAGASTVTLSFWVRSSLTGTFGGSFSNGATNRSYPFTYTINAANTWEYKTVTIAGDTTGTWVGATNGTGLNVQFSLGTGTTLSGTANAWAGAFYGSATGATSVVGTSGATFYITGVQLEVGSSATGFEYVDQTVELAMCYRYYYKLANSSQYLRIATGPASSTTVLNAYAILPISMRTSPTSIDVTGSLGVWNGGGIASVSVLALASDSLSPFTAAMTATTTGLTSGAFYTLLGNNSSTASVAFNAEL